MSTSFPQLKLFPLYPGGPVRYGRTNSSLSATSSFYTRATAFTPSYGVNVPPTTDWSQRDTYFVLQPNGTLGQRPVSEASMFNLNLGLDGSRTGGLRNVETPAVAPGIPNIYQDLAALYNITDANFNDLMAQPEFRIPGIGLGLKVTTDGMGGVDTVSISPGARGILPAASALPGELGGVNRAEITTGAIFTSDPGSGLGGSLSNNPASGARNRIVSNNVAGADVNGVNALGRNAGIFNVNRLNSPEGLGGLGGLGKADGDRLAGNPLLARLAQLQRPEPGLAIVGAESQLSVNQMRQFAATQAGLEVSVGNRFRQNVAELASASRMQEGYATTHRPLGIERVMDGRMPLAPSMPNIAAGNGSASGMGGQAGFSMGSEVLDAGARRGSGGYIPTRMEWQFGQSGGGSGAAFGTLGGGAFGGTSGGGAFGGAGSGGQLAGGQANPFLGGQSSSSQEQSRRRPFALRA